MVAMAGTRVVTTAASHDDIEWEITENAFVVALYRAVGIPLRLYQGTNVRECVNAVMCSSSLRLASKDMMSGHF